MSTRLGVLTLNGVNVEAFQRPDQRWAWIITIDEVVYSGFGPRILPTREPEEARLLAVMAVLKHPVLRRELGATRIADLTEWVTQHLPDNARYAG